MHIPDLAARPRRPEADKLNNIDLIKELLAHKANPNEPLKRNFAGMVAGTTPLMRAAKSGDSVAMEVLLTGGADPNITTQDHTNALMVAAGGAAPGGFGLGGAVQVTEPRSIEAIKLFLAKGIDINAANDAGNTALHSAAGKGWDQVVRFLVEQGAKIDLKNKQGFTPIDLAMGKGGRGGANAVGNGRAGHETTVALLEELSKK